MKMLGIYFYVFNMALINNRMDDFLYFLLLIGWLGYSIYRQNEKKKKLQAKKLAAEQEPARPTAPFPEPYTEVQEKPVLTEPDFAKTLEEILLGKNEIESLETIPETEAQSLESIPEPVNQYKELNNKNISNQSIWYEEAAPVVERTTDTVKVEEPQMALVDEDVIRKDEELHHFNLRSAVVYSEILNRKYS